MGRISAGNDVKLIKAGTALARKKGFNGFTVRDVCTKSKVNLGMFHYHFGSKDNFDIAVLKKIYFEMLDSITVAVSPANTPKENVRAILKHITVFVTKNRILISSLAGDVFTGNKKIMNFIVKNFTVHISIMYQELKRAEKEGSLAVKEVEDAMFILVSPIVVPNIILGLAGRFDLSLMQKAKVALFRGKIESGFEARTELLINAVFKGK